MPRVQEMRKKGLGFSKFFVTDSACCPSRATILTGKLPHNTGVLRNVPPHGGHSVFKERGNEAMTYAVGLQRAGYRTAMMGKYMNEYPVKSGTVPPGWSEWYVTDLGYEQYGYELNENGKVVPYGHEPDDYLNDVITRKGVDFISRSAKADQPFMLQLSSFTPHAPFPPAPRHEQALPGLTAPRPPAFNEADISDKPQWMRNYPQLSQRDKNLIDERFRKRAQSVQAVDEMLGQVQRALADNGVDRDTYVIFSSDNGLHMGEHRLVGGKMTAYDSDILVPLVVTGPGVPAGATVDRLTQNTDLYATFLDLANVPVPAHHDGRSLAPFILGRPVESWRGGVLIEHMGPVESPNDPDLPNRRGGNPPSYSAVRTSEELYVEYEYGDREYYDLTQDPYQLQNAATEPPGPRQVELSRLLHSLESCAGEACRAADGAS
ncbi:sulfatase [Actinomadura sp. LOL_016]|uniref:sulfatase family protein n=1 Tax=unclassified Actinomadura TaxID=2626254 RepID=UPI003A7FC2D9